MPYLQEGAFQGGRRKIIYDSSLEEYEPLRRINEKWVKSERSLVVNLWRIYKWDWWILLRSLEATLRRIKWGWWILL